MKANIIFEFKEDVAEMVKEWDEILKEIEKSKKIIFHAGMRSGKTRLQKVIEINNSTNG